jgi:3-oxoacyl-[acyl-carrier-protein] synthase-3
MAELTFSGVRIAGLSACVPSAVVKTRDPGPPLSPQERDRIADSVGILERRVAPPGVCASDLCLAAAARLLDAMNIDRSTIDVLIFTSQTGDFRVPATAPSLQHRLGLPEACAAFDLGLGCSGYLYALATAFGYAANPGIRRVLLLDGETITRLTSPLDKVSGPLYGDAGTATLIEKGGGESRFSLGSAGAGAGAIAIQAGGCRCPGGPESHELVAREDGSLRSDQQLAMDGMAVFNFAMKAVPGNVMGLLRGAGLSFTDVDHLVFHQASRSTNDFLARIMKCPAGKVPSSLDRFGNTGSASVPLTIVTELQASLREPRRLLLSAHGAGLSWAGALLTLDGCVVPDLAEI